MNRNEDARLATTKKILLSPAPFKVAAILLGPQVCWQLLPEYCTKVCLRLIRLILYKGN